MLAAHLALQLHWRCIGKPLGRRSFRSMDYFPFLLFINLLRIQYLLFYFMIISLCVFIYSNQGNPKFCANCILLFQSFALCMHWEEHWKSLLLQAFFELNHLQLILRNECVDALCLGNRFSQEGLLMHQIFKALPVGSFFF